LLPEIVNESTSPGASMEHWIVCPKLIPGGQAGALTVVLAVVELLAW
jgi:hypothetical protein